MKGHAYMGARLWNAAGKGENGWEGWEDQRGMVFREKAVCFALV
jgi:hypothetical protein